jgi:antibiotic biosynthesis monooxygenase (ABM) superfamily enzyme
MAAQDVEGAGGFSRVHGFRAVRAVEGVQDRWVVIFRFDTREHLGLRLESDVRQRLTLTVDREVSNAGAPLFISNVLCVSVLTWFMVPLVDRGLLIVGMGLVVVWCVLLIAMFALAT